MRGGRALGLSTFKVAPLRCLLSSTMQRYEDMLNDMSIFPKMFSFKPNF